MLARSRRLTIDIWRLPEASQAAISSLIEHSTSPDALTRQALRVLAVVVACYVGLVATHGGEFWPFSSYPMFARAGRPWQRALVRVVDGSVLRAAYAREYMLDALPGAPLPLAREGIPQNDMSSLLQNAERWAAVDLASLASLFGALPCRAPLLVLRVRGALEDETVHSVAAATAALSCESGQVVVRRLLPRAP